MSTFDFSPLYRTVVGFDRLNARAFGATPTAADLLLVLLVGAFTVVAVQALGSLLVLAMLVGPAATARLAMPLAAGSIKPRHSSH